MPAQENPTPEHIVENNNERATTVTEAFNQLFFINKGCQEYEKEHLLGYYSRSPNDTYLNNLITRLEKCTNLLKEAKEL